MPILLLAARHAKLCLVAGLLAGLTLPGVAQTLRPWLPELVALLLFLSALRIGPARALGGMAEAGSSLRLVLVFQLALPLLGLGLLWGAGLLGTAIGLVLLLVLSAPPVTGSPNFTALMGFDPAPALQVLILATALFPVTVLPILWSVPALGGAGAVLSAAVRLVAVIAVAVACGFVAHHLLRPARHPRRLSAIDGASALALAVVVVGLMSALGPALRSAPLSVAGWLAFACALNFGLQILTWAALRAPGYAIQCGNRNIALFLVALPEDVTGPILLFIGCYQVPMYLTPVVMPRVFGRASGQPGT